MDGGDGGTPNLNRSTNEPTPYGCRSVMTRYMIPELFSVVDQIQCFRLDLLNFCYCYTVEVFLRGFYCANWLVLLQDCAVNYYDSGMRWKIGDWAKEQIKNSVPNCLAGILI